MKILRSLGSFLLICAFLPAAAQVSFKTVPSSQEIGLHDYVQIEFVIENAKQIDDLQLPVINNFRIMQGPDQSSGMSVVNGAMSQYKAFIYVVQPTGIGKFTIPGASATVDGKSMKSNPVTIKVIGKSTTGGNGNTNSFNPLPDPVFPGTQPDIRREYIIKPGENVSEKIAKNFFIRVDLNKASCYAGEPIIATYKLCSRLQSESRVIKQPSLNGFSVYDMTNPGNDQSTIERYNGKPFDVHIIRKVQLIPLQAGPAQLDPVELDNTIHFVKSDHQAPAPHGGNSIRELFDRFFDEEPQGTAFDQQINLNSKPVDINVKPLPEENKPVDFGGAVGHYTIRSSLQNGSLNAGDAALLIVSIKGNGNLPVVNAPLINWPSDIEPYDVATKENIDKSVFPLGGSKTFEFNFVPGKEGKYTIPPVQLSYFDPSANAYKTVQSDPVHFSVGPPKAGKINKHILTAVAADPSGRSWNYYLFAFAKWVFAPLLLLGIIIYLIWKNKLLLRQERAKAFRKQALDRAAIEEKMPKPLPTDLLLDSKILKERGDFAAFYTSVNRVIWKALAEKVKRPASEMNKSVISAALQSAGWSTTDLMLLNDTLRECEMKLYTPDHDSAEIERMLTQAERIVHLLA